MAIHPAVSVIFQFGPKLWSDGQSDTGIQGTDKIQSTAWPGRAGENYSHGNTAQPVGSTHQASVSQKVQFQSKTE